MAVVVRCSPVKFLQKTFLYKYQVSSIQRLHSKKIMMNAASKKQEYFEAINLYKNFLPRSFMEDTSAPFFGSYMWLQRIGRLDLHDEMNKEKDKNFFSHNFDKNFRPDPVFKISKKTKKKKYNTILSTISVGKNREELMIAFDYNKKKEDTSVFTINNKSIDRKTKLDIETTTFSFFFIKIYTVPMFRSIRIGLSILLLGFTFCFSYF